METSTKALLKGVRFSYANVWQPRENDDKSLSYGTAILIPKDDAGNKKTIDAIIDVLVAEAKSKNKGKLPVKFKMPLRDGDDEKPDDENYAGHWFLNAKSTTKPGIVSTDRDADNKPKAITNEAEFYSGCYGHVTVSFFLFDKKGNVGIGVGLNNIMKTKDGTPLAGKTSAAEDFADIEVEENDDDLG